MPNPLVLIPAVIGAAGVIGGSLIDSASSNKATEAQTQSAQAAIDEQTRQFDFQKELLQPFVDVGSPALTEQMALLGLGGEGAEQAAIDRITSGSQFTTAVDESERAILQNASATGGLRGGDTESVLARNRPNILNSLIASRQNALGGVASNAQNAAGGLASASQNVANQVSGQLVNQGTAAANNALTQGDIGINAISGISDVIGTAIPQIPELRNKF